MTGRSARGWLHRSGPGRRRRAPGRSAARGVLVFHPSDEAYGADRVLLAVVDALRAEHPLQVWLPRDVPYPHRALSRELERRGVPVARADLPILRRAYFTARHLVRLAWRSVTVASLVRADPARVCYLNTSATLLIAPVARLLGRTVVLHAHETWGRRERSMLGCLARCCHRVIAVSRAVRDGLPPAVRDRCEVIYNGFPVPEPDPATRSMLRGRIGARDRDLVALLASRWNAGKGHEMILDAWSRLERDDLHLVVLGGPPAVGAAVDVPSAVAGRPGMDKVHVVGETPEVDEWLNACDVVLVPSTQPDSLPTIAIEGMAMSRPVFASEIGGLPEIVVDGVTGRLFPPTSQEAWLEGLSAMRRAELADIGAAARRRFDTTFASERFSADMRRFMASVLPESHPPGTRNAAPPSAASARTAGTRPRDRGQ